MLALTFLLPLLTTQAVSLKNDPIFRGSPASEGSLESNEKEAGVIFLAACSQQGQRDPTSQVLQPLLLALARGTLGAVGALRANVQFSAFLCIRSTEMPVLRFVQVTRRAPGGVPNGNL